MNQDTPAASPLVSVVMATYRGDRLDHLREAVESVLGQTYAALELILVLDGPLAEATRAYLDARARTDARLRLRPLEANAGQARARNAGIAEARGDFIAILDADDLALPERLARQRAFLEATGADLAGSCYTLIDEEGLALREKRVPLTAAVLRRWVCAFNPIANSTVFARAEVLKAHGYSEDRPGGKGPASYGEDYELWVTLLRAGFRIENQPDALVHFRTQRNFLAKRSGWAPFRADLRTKLRTLPLYPLWARPLVLPVCLLTAMARLLPAGALAVLYRLRDRMRF